MSILLRCPSYRDPNNGRKERQGPTVGVHLIEVSITRELTVFLKILSEIKEEAKETRAEVKSFDHSKLKHVETEEKNPLPKQSGKCALF